MKKSAAVTLSSAFASLGRWNWRALGGNEDTGGRLDLELSRVIALVDGNADATPRIYIKERVAHGNIHERFCIRHRNRLLVDLHRHLVALDVAQLSKFFPAEVGDQRSERVIQADDI